MSLFTLEFDSYSADSSKSQDGQEVKKDIIHKEGTPKQTHRIAKGRGTPTRGRGRGTRSPAKARGRGRGTKGHRPEHREQPNQKKKIEPLNISSHSTESNSGDSSTVPPLVTADNVPQPLDPNYPSLSESSDSEQRIVPNTLIPEISSDSDRKPQRSGTQSPVNFVNPQPLQQGPKNRISNKLVEIEEEDSSDFEKPNVNSSNSPSSVDHKEEEEYEEEEEAPKIISKGIQQQPPPNKPIDNHIETPHKEPQQHQIFEQPHIEPKEQQHTNSIPFQPHKEQPKSITYLINRDVHKGISKSILFTLMEHGNPKFASKIRSRKDVNIPIQKNITFVSSMPIDAVLVQGSKSQDFSLRDKDSYGEQLLQIKFIPGSSPADVGRKAVITFKSLQGMPSKLLTRTPMIDPSGIPTYDFQGHYSQKSIKNAVFYENQNGPNLLMVRKVGKNQIEIDVHFECDPLWIFAIGVASFISTVH